MENIRQYNINSIITNPFIYNMNQNRDKDDERKIPKYNWEKRINNLVDKGEMSHNEGESVKDSIRKNWGERDEPR